MTRHALRFAAAAVLVLFAVAGHGAPPPGDEKPAASGLHALVRSGDKAPAFALEDLDGRTVSVKPGDGRPSLIVFFSVFCPLCRELAPPIAELAARRGAALRVVGVNVDGRRFSSAVRSFADEQGLKFPVLLDEIRDDLLVASDPYGVDKTPTAVLVDRRGIVTATYVAEAIRKLLSDVAGGGAGSEEGDGIAK